MAPALRPGQLVIGVKPRNIRSGDVVMVRHDGLDKIKRVKLVEANKIFLIGDNSLQSTDSRHFGWLDNRLIVARIAWPNVARTQD